MGRFIVALLLMFLLAACGADTDDTNDSAETGDDVAVVDDSQAETDTEEESDDNADESVAFALTVSGKETFDFDANLVFVCREDQFLAQTFTQSPKFDLYLPSSIEIGSYPLADYDANAVPIYVEGSAVVAVRGETPEDGSLADFYFMDNTGELIIEAIPSEVGEPFVGNLTGTLANSDGETIDIVASFNQVTESSYFVDCEF